jgi:hypothetical protein
VSTACTGHTQPNTAKSACVACTSPSSGNTWASVNGCAVTACTTTLPYGNIWDSTDTTGACKQTMCVDWDIVIPGKYFSGTSSCTRQTCPGTLTGGNGWDPDYNGTFATCRQGPMVFVPGFTFDVNSFPAQYGLFKDATSTNGTVAFSTSVAQAGNSSIASAVTLRSGSAFAAGYTHIQFMPRSTTDVKYFKITSKYTATLSDTYVYGYMVDGVTNLNISPFWSGTYTSGGQLRTSGISENPVVFGRMCQGPAGTSGQYLDKTTCALSTCATPASYGQYWTLPGIACDLGTCTIPANQVFTQTGSCSAPVSNCVALSGGNVYSTSRPNGLGVCPASVACSPAATYGQYWTIPGLTCGLATCATSVAANQIYTTLGQCTISNCAALSGGSVYSTTRTNTGTCPASVACSPAATYGQYWTSPGLTCGLATCATSVAANQIYTTLGQCTISNCLPVAQGTYYSTTRTDTATCPSVLNCPTGLTGTNGWVTNLSGAGTTCAQKVLTWVTAFSKTAIIAGNYIKITKLTYTAWNDTLRTYKIEMNLTIPISVWLPGLPTSGYTHIRLNMPYNTGTFSGSSVFTFQISTPIVSTDTAIYGFFTDINATSNTNQRRPADSWTYSPANNVTLNFGNYT